MGRFEYEEILNIVILLVSRDAVEAKKGDPGLQVLIILSHRLHFLYALAVSATCNKHCYLFSLDSYDALSLTGEVTL